jgi:hypothetical protein
MLSGAGREFRFSPTSKLRITIPSIALFAVFAQTAALPRGHWIGVGPKANLLLPGILLSGEI